MSRNLAVVVLRISAGLIIVLSLGAAGYLNRSPWINVLAAPALTLLYALGKLRAWKNTWRRGIKAIIFDVLVTVPVQMLLAFILYFLGLGLSHLFAPGPIHTINESDVLAVLSVLMICLIFSLIIIRLETKKLAPLSEYADSTLELDIDPTPLTPETFYESPGYWCPDTAREALEGRGKPINKLPLFASLEEIEATERRIGFKLPESLRQLYCIQNGGYVGWLYVAAKPNPAPIYDDWRGAFSIDYSSLYPLNELHTVQEYYEDYDSEPPAHADKLLILQARYGDMTLLDYSKPGEPKVVIIDFDQINSADSCNQLEFLTFDDFFKALRRPKKSAPSVINSAYIALYRSQPLSTLPKEIRATEFWGSKPHTFANLAKARNDGWLPKPKANAALIAETEMRLGLKLPAAIKTLWQERNGGEVLYRFLCEETETCLFEELAPMEYFATLHTLSQRIRFPAGETPWHESIMGTEKLLVLDTKQQATLLLDYRNTDQPSLLWANSGIAEIDTARRFKNIDELIGKLRKSQPRP